MNWIKQTPGWILLYEEALLQALCSTLPGNPQTINIGAGAGTSTCAMLRAGAYVASIDIDDEMFKQEAEAAKKQNLNVFNLSQVKQPSNEAYKLFPDETADLVFVDGIHSYDGVASDLALYTPKLKPGGILVCHDYGDPRQKEVTRAIKEWRKANRSWLEIGKALYMIAYRKPGGDEGWRNGRV